MQEKTHHFTIPVNPSDRNHQSLVFSLVLVNAFKKQDLLDVYGSYLRDSAAATSKNILQQFS